MNALAIAMHSNMNVIIYGLGMDARVPNALGTQTNYGLGMDALICGRSWSINRCIGASLRRSGPGAWHRCISVGASVRRSEPGARHRCIGVWRRACTFRARGSVPPYQCFPRAQYRCIGVSVPGCFLRRCLRPLCNVAKNFKRTECNLQFNVLSFYEDRKKHLQETGACTFFKSVGLLLLRKRL